jgi:hypothetical protein
MRRMTVALWLGGITLVLVFLWASGAFAAESGHQDAIQRALASSALSPADQAVVRSRAAAAISAGIPAEDVGIIVSRGLNRGADAGAVNRFLDVGVSAKRSGVPVGPVLDRIEEGLSKGVPAERVAASSERFTEKLMAAQPLVDGLIRGGMTPRRSAEREEAIASTARALERSISPEAIKEMGAAVRGKQGSLTLFTNSMDTAAYFAGSGMSSKTASRLVQNAVEKGSSGRDLNAMVRRSVEEMKQGGKARNIATKAEHEKKTELKNKTMNDKRDMERHEDMHEEMRGSGGAGSGPSGMGGMGGMGGRGR